MVVLLAQPLWLGWPSAAPPPPLLGVLRPISFGVGVICDSFCFCGACEQLVFHACFEGVVVLSSCCVLKVSVLQVLIELMLCARW